MLDQLLTNPHSIAVMILILMAPVMFTRENVPYETTSLFVLVVLVVGFHLFPHEDATGTRLKPSDFLLGFGHKALIAVSGLMIVGEGLIRTGALGNRGTVYSIRSWA